MLSGVNLEQENETLRHENRVFKNKEVFNKKEISHLQKLVEGLEHELSFVKVELNLSKQRERSMKKEALELKNSYREIYNELERKNVGAAPVKQKPEEIVVYPDTLEEETPSKPLTSTLKEEMENKNLEKIEQLSKIVNDLKQTNQQLECKLKDSSWTLGHMEDENHELKNLNKQLMQDCESYERLLEEKTMSGEIIGSTIIRKHNNKKKSIFDDLVPKPQETGEIDEADVSILQQENVSLKDEVAALATYITNIVKKLSQEEGLEKFLCFGGNYDHSLVEEDQDSKKIAKNRRSIIGSLRKPSSQEHIFLDRLSVDLEKQSLSIANSRKKSSRGKIFGFF